MRARTAKFSRNIAALRRKTPGSDQGIRKTRTGIVHLGTGTCAWLSRVSIRPGPSDLVVLIGVAKGEEHGWVRNTVARGIQQPQIGQKQDLAGPPRRPA